MYLLTLLKREGPATVSEIARRFQIAKPNITPLIDRLVADGLAERVRGEHDKRVIYVRLKAEGEQRLADFCDDATDHLLARSDRLSRQDYIELRTACETLTDIVRRATEEE